MSPPPRPGARGTTENFDWSQWYVEADHVAESGEQGAIIEELRSSIRELARRRRWKRVFVGGDNYFAWIPSEPLVRVSPDVYLLDTPPPEPLPKSWQTWRPDHPPPRWAVEIVSDDWQKDYHDNPAKYAQLGCSELVLFDPELVLTRTARRQAPERAALTVLRRGSSATLDVVYSGQGPAYSRELGAWLVAERDGYTVRLRVALDEAGTRLIPTREEAERRRAEAEKQRAKRLVEAEKVRAERRVEAEKVRAEKRVAAAMRRAEAARQAEKKRAAAARRRAEQRERQLIEKLRRAGIEPDDESN